jgi:hypothetical protein
MYRMIFKVFANFLAKGGSFEYVGIILWAVPITLKDFCR